MRTQASLLFLLKLLKAPLSIVILSLTAKYFGVSLEKDVWLLAYSFVIMLDLAVWGPVNETFRTRFVTLKEESGENVALRKTQSLLLYVFCGSCIIVAAIVFFANFFASIIAPSYTGVQLQSLVNMVRFVAPLLLLNQFTLIGNSILNAYEVFYVPEIASFFSQIANIIILLLLAPSIGVYALLVSAALSNFLLILFMLYYLRKINVNIFRNFNFRIDGFSYFFIFALPFFIPYFFGQVNNLVEKSIASTLGTGAVSIIDYARRISDILSGVLISVVLSIVVPVLTKAFVRKEKEEFENNFFSAFQLGLFLLMMYIAFMFTASSEVNNLLFSSKNVENSDMENIILISKYYAVALLAIFSYIVLGMCMMATGKSKLYAALGTVAQILVILINLVFAPVLGIEVFPVAIFLSHAACAIIMGFNYPYSRNILVSEFFRYLLFGVLLSVSLYFTNSIVRQFYIPSSAVVGIILIAIVQIALTAIWSYLCKIKEIQILIKKLFLK